MNLGTEYGMTHRLPAISLILTRGVAREQEEDV
jgi:hypothetical protein